MQSYAHWYGIKHQEETVLHFPECSGFTWLKSLPSKVQRFYFLQKDLLSFWKLTLSFRSSPESCLAKPLDRVRKCISMVWLCGLELWEQTGVWDYPFHALRKWKPNVIDAVMDRNACPYSIMRNGIFGITTLRASKQGTLTKKQNK